MSMKVSSFILFLAFFHHQTKVKASLSCPDNEKVNCLVEPCKNSNCTLFPYAKCVNNYCGDCNVEWYYYSKLVDCNGFSCAKPQVLRCGKEPCRGEVCKNFPDAKCINNYCGSCSPNWYLGSKKVNCNGETKTHPDSCTDQFKVICPEKPCKFSKCPNYPHAKCVNNYCGGCFADWYLNKNLVDCDKPTTKKANTHATTKCNIVQCFVDPCRVSKCPCYPAAKCVSNYCGGCNADWFVNNTQVDCKSISNQTVNSCLIDPCQYAKCTRYPKAICVSNYCGGCKAEWYIGSVKVNCKK